MLKRWQFGEVLKTEYVRVGGSCYIRRLMVDVDAHIMQLVPGFWYQWITAEEYEHHKSDADPVMGDGQERVISEHTSRVPER